MNCCGRRAYFTCDDAWVPTARGGMVIHDAAGFAKDRHDYYMMAIKQAEATFGIFAAKEPLFVRWVQDPDTVEAAFWTTGVTIVGIAIGVHLLFSMLLAHTISSSLGASN